MKIYLQVFIVLVAVLLVCGGFYYYVDQKKEMNADRPTSVENGINKSTFTYKTKVSIGSKEDFVTFLQEKENVLEDQYGNKVLELDNYRDQSQSIDWKRVSESVTISTDGKKTIYSLEYRPAQCSDYTISMTNAGIITLFANCGV